MKTSFAPHLIAACVALSSCWPAFSQAQALVQARGTIEVAFSPNGGAQALVIKAIGSAQRDIRLLAYSFTSAPVVQALLQAKRRGVDVKVVVDRSHNLGRDEGGKGKAALSALATAGVDVRTINAYPIHHDKTIVIDGKHLQLGSFNYSAAAENKNSEHVAVMWDNAALAQIYLAHFMRNYAQSVAFHANY